MPVSFTSEAQLFTNDFSNVSYLVVYYHHLREPFGANLLLGDPSFDSDGSGLSLVVPP